jgi:hypothetical protein
MTDMTQPERPERAEVPDNEVQFSSEGAEPTHIGIAKHREARESFNPLVPQTPDTGPNAPSGPADRSSIESLRREAERLASRSQPAEAPSIPLGEPLKPRKEGGMPLKAKIGAATGALAVAAGGFLGFNKIRSGDDGSERPGVIITDPTLKPTEPAPTFTPEATQEPTQEPIATNTPQPPTETPIEIPTPEPTPPDPEVQSVLDRLYEIGWAEKWGKATFAVTKGMQEREECFYRGGRNEFLPCSSIDSIQLNLEDYPDAIERQNEGIDYFFYTTWKEQNESNITFEEYKNRVDNGEQLYIEIAATTEGKKVSKHPINVNSGITFVYVEDNSNNITTLTTAHGYGFRVINGQLIVEMHSFGAGGVGNNNEAQANPSKFGVALEVVWALTFMSDQGIQRQLELLIDGQVSASESMTRMFERLNILGDYFIPFQNGHTLETSTEVNSIYRAEGTYRPTILK